MPGAFASQSASRQHIRRGVKHHTHVWLIPIIVISTVLVDKYCHVVYFIQIWVWTTIAFYIATLPAILKASITTAHLVIGKGLQFMLWSYAFGPDSCHPPDHDDAWSCGVLKRWISVAYCHFKQKVGFPSIYSVILNKSVGFFKKVP